MMKISVLMTLYGRDDAAHLVQALQSLVDQTRRADEVVLVEDGPLSPGLEKTIETFRASLNIVSVKLPYNVGLARALNEGLRHCSHEFVARMDADDICLPERFEIQAAYFIADPALDVVGSGAIEIDAEGRRGAQRAVPVLHGRIVENLWWCPFIHPSVMIKGSRLSGVGGYEETLLRRQDYELWFRCHKNGFRFANVAEPLILYRFTPATLRKQSFRSAWKQGVIGFKGARSIGMPLWKQVACFAPFIRSLLPVGVNRAVYRLMTGLKVRHLAP